MKRFIFKESSSTSKGKDYRTEIQKIFNSFGDSKKSRYHNRYNDYSRDWETVFNLMDVFLKKADFFLSLGDMDTYYCHSFFKHFVLSVRIMRMNYYILTMMMTLALPLIVSMQEVYS